jgi:flavorubredoxin
MPERTLYDDGNHANYLLEDFGHGEMVQANQHLVIHGGHAMILDPGGHKVYNRVLPETTRLLGPAGRLRYIFLSHQDPDIVAAINGWMMTTDAVAYVSALWIRFIPHFGLDRLVAHRLRPIPDEGMHLDLNGCSLALLPAHFLHSPGNFQVFDPVSKVLYSGDLGASLGPNDVAVTDFDAHRPHMEGFHRRYMASGRSLRAWAKMVRPLGVEVIAPQHGAVFKGREMVERFLAWSETVECGVDVMGDAYRYPPR